jgi:hypothetical protein
VLRKNANNNCSEKNCVTMCLKEPIHKKSLWVWRVQLKKQHILRSKNIQINEENVFFSIFLVEI